MLTVERKKNKYNINDISFADKRKLHMLNSICFSNGKINQEKYYEMLEMTKLNLTSQDAQHFVGSGVQKPNFASSKASQLGMSGAEPGLDLSKLDFVSKAKSILDLSNKKDKQKAGLA